MSDDLGRARARARKLADQIDAYLAAPTDWDPRPTVQESTDVG